MKLSPTFFALLLAWLSISTVDAQIGWEPWRLWEGWLGTQVHRIPLDLDGDRINDLELERVYRGSVDPGNILRVNVSWSVRGLASNVVLGAESGVAVLQAGESLRLEPSAPHYWTQAKVWLGEFECDCGLHHVPPLRSAQSGPFGISEGFFAAKINTLGGARLAWIKVTSGPFQPAMCPSDGMPAVDYGFQADPALPMSVGETRSIGKDIHYVRIDCNRDAVADLTVERRFRIREGAPPEPISITLIARPGVQILVREPDPAEGVARRYPSDLRIPAGGEVQYPTPEIGTFAKWVQYRWIIPEVPRSPLAWSESGGFAVLFSVDPESGVPTGPLVGLELAHFIVRLDGKSADAITLDKTGEVHSIGDFARGYGSVGERLVDRERLHLWDIDGDELVDFTETRSLHFGTGTWPHPGYGILYWDGSMVEAMFSPWSDFFVIPVALGTTVPAELKQSNPAFPAGLWHLNTVRDEIGAIYPIAAKKDGKVHAGWIKLIQGIDHPKRAEIYLSPIPEKPLRAGFKEEPEDLAPLLNVTRSVWGEQLDVEWNIWDALSRGYVLERLRALEGATWERVPDYDLIFRNEKGARIQSVAGGSPRMLYRLRKP